MNIYNRMIFYNSGSSMTQTVRILAESTRKPPLSNIPDEPCYAGHEYYRAEEPI